MAKLIEMDEVTLRPNGKPNGKPSGRSSSFDK